MEKPKFGTPLHRVWIEPTGRYGPRGEIYRVLTDDGDLLASGWAPEHDACRALQSLGLTGTVGFWRRGRPSWDFRMVIEHAAKYSLIENDRGFSLRKWQPMREIGATREHT